MRTFILSFFGILLGTSAYGTTLYPDVCTYKIQIAVSTLSKSLGKCYSTAAKTGVAVSPSCIALAESKFNIKYDAAIKTLTDKGISCPMAKSKTQLLADFKSNLVANLTPLMPPAAKVSMCQASKIDGAASFMKSDFKSIAFYTKKSDLVVLGSKRAKSDAKLTSVFTAAELKTDCSTRGDLVNVKSAALTLIDNTLIALRPPVPCTFTLSTNAISSSSLGTSGSVTLTAPTSCSWTSSNIPSWLTLSPQSGVGSATINYQFALNTTTLDRSANISIGSATLAASQTKDAIKPVTITGFSATLEGNSISLNWNPTTDTGGSGLSSYILVKNQAQNITLDSSLTTYLDSAVTAGNQYCYIIKATDNVGNTSDDSQQACVTVPTVPVPCSYSISQNSISVDSLGSSAQITLTTQVGCNWAVTNLPAWMTMQPMSGSGSADLTYQISLNSGVTRQTTINIADKAVNVSQTQDSISPAQVMGVTSYAFATSAIIINWNATSDSGGSGLAGYQVEIDGNQTVNLASNILSYSDNTVTPGSQHCYRLKAIDGMGNTSIESSPSCTTVPELAPAAPSNLVAQALSNLEIDLAWQDNSSNETAFAIEALYPPNSSYVKIAQVGAGITAYKWIASFTPSTLYTFRVRAENPNAIAPSAYSAESSVTTPACTYSISPTTLAANSDAGQYTISVSTSSSCPWTPTTTSPFISVSGSGVGSGQFNVIVAANNTTDIRSGTVSVGDQVLPVNQSKDSIAPSFVTGFAASNITTTSLDLSWNPSTDTGGSGISGYILFRNSVLLGKTTSTTFSDSGLTPGSIYYYSVQAVDNAGNTSYQNYLNQSTLPLPPNSPTNVYVSVTSLNFLTLKWTAPSPNTADGIEVFYSTNSAGPFTSNGFISKYNTTATIVGLNPDTTYYAKLRYYNSGGESFSNTVSAKTLCSVSFSPTSLTVTGDPQWVNLSLTAASTCTWNSRLGTNVGGVQPGSGTGSANISVYVFGNTTNQQRTAQFSVNGVVYQLTQQGDLTPPAAPNVFGYSIPFTTGTPTLHYMWDGSTDTGGGYVLKYNFSKNGTLLGSPFGPEIWDNAGYTDGTPINISIQSVDTAGNTSSAGNFQIAPTLNNHTLIASRQLTSGPGSADIYASAIDIRNNDKVVLGEFTGDVTIGTQVLTGGAYTPFIAKFAPNGTLKWAHEIITDTDLRGIAVSAAGEIGVYGDDVNWGIEAIKFSENGVEAWRSQYDLPDTSYDSVMANDSAIVVTYSTSGKGSILVAGNYYKDKTGCTDGWVFKFGPSGSSKFDSVDGPAPASSCIDDDTLDIDIIKPGATEEIIITGITGEETATDWWDNFFVKRLTSTGSNKFFTLIKDGASGAKIAADNTNNQSVVYDSEDKVMRFSSTGTLLSSFYPMMAGPDTMKIDATGNVVFLFSGNIPMVHKYSTTGSFLVGRSFLKANTTSFFYTPSEGLLINSNGDIDVMAELQGAENFGTGVVGSSSYYSIINFTVHP